MTLKQDDILEALVKLDQKGLRQASARIKSLINEKEEDDPRMEYAMLVWTPLVETVRSMTGLRVPPRGQVLTGAMRSNFLRDSEMLLGYIDEYLKPANRTKRLAVLRYLMEMLARNIVSTKGSVNYLRMFHRLKQLPDIIEDAYPGYPKELLPAVFAMEGAVKLS